ncbi:MAG: efflux RND transporter periplasmic adaptor subunit [Calditrichaeota bacterium]|nr:efflux RND transporter periplasmic adaptor subunit [Calditrichota bacterium]RQV92767.1 MAG: efflux RND transporter periplasmic adaptor subunit [bacterium]
MKNSQTFLIGFLLFFVVLTSCDSSGSNSGSEVQKVPVEVTRVQLGAVKQPLQFNGDIKAEVEVNVYSKVPDRIEKFYVDEGDYIRQGVLLAKIVATTIEQGVRQAEAGLLSAKAQAANLRVEFERAKRLYQENAMSNQQYDAVSTQYEAVKAQVQQAEAALASVKSQLNDATLTAPISGIIGKRYYETGDMANPSLPVVKIVKMDRVKIEFDATEEDLGKLKVGQDASIFVKAYHDKIFSGKVTRISPILDPMSRMAKIEVIVDNPEHLLKPGMFALVEVTIGVIEDVVVIPRYSTIESTTLEKIDGEDTVIRNYYVFVVDSGYAVQKKLDALYVNHKWIAVNSGLDVGDQLVIAGQNNLREGSAVLVSEEKEILP